MAWCRPPPRRCSGTSLGGFFGRLEGGSTNAIPNQGTITISAGNVLAKDAELQALVGHTTTPYVRIEVADDGVGMDADTRQHAFEPFFTTKAMGKGTGLGLSMVCGEVQELHGVVRIDSKPNRGTSIQHLVARAPELSRCSVDCLVTDDRRDRLPLGVIGVSPAQRP
jgi:hypothetical protein